MEGRSRLVPLAQETEGVFTWEVLFTFTTNYTLPDGVHERAVVRAIQDSKHVKVLELRQLT